MGDTVAVDKVPYVLQSAGIPHVFGATMEPCCKKLFNFIQATTRVGPSFPCNASSETKSPPA